MPLLAASVLGVVMMLYRRERALAPLLAFGVLYGWVVWRSPLVFNRYALPLAGPAAVLAAYGLHHAMSFRARVAVATLLVAIGLPACLAYDHLIAQEDTRVESARWLAQHVRPDAAVFLPGNLLTAIYLGPDLPKPLSVTGLPPDRAEALQARMPPRFPHRRRYLLRPARYAASPPGPGRLASWENGIVVTSETREGPFAKESTPADLVADLERHAVLLADYPVERSPGPRTYEPDLNYVPMRGMSTLRRPGPRLRIWYVPPSRPSADPSPLLEHSPARTE
jgi:hypothetical protein